LNRDDGLAGFAAENQAIKAMTPETLVASISEAYPYLQSLWDLLTDKLDARAVFHYIIAKSFGIRQSFEFFTISGFNFIINQFYNFYMSHAGDLPDAETHATEYKTIMDRAFQISEKTRMGIKSDYKRRWRTPRKGIRDDVDRTDDAFKERRRKHAKLITSEKPSAIKAATVEAYQKKLNELKKFVKRAALNGGSRSRSSNKREHGSRSRWWSDF
jgi:hypothetical protein